MVIRVEKRKIFPAPCILCICWRGSLGIGYRRTESKN